jgi:hypothetical protein
MARLEPPPGMITRADAVKALTREGVITSPAMLTKLKGVDRVVPDGRTHGFYPEDRLLQIVNDRRAYYGKPAITKLFDDEHAIVFRQATPEDMIGVYEVAVKLFGHTTSIQDRIPLIQRCPEGNVVVLDQGKIVSYAHIQPLLKGTLNRFLAGEIRGKDIKADDLDPFATGKVVDILIKSLGSYHEHSSTRKRYSKALFVGLRHELMRWGHKGYIIHRVYATSETPSGVEAAVEFKMTSLGKIKGSKGKKRFAFELDPLSSDYAMLKIYQEALLEWQVEHMDKYDQAWKTWATQNAK